MNKITKEMSIQDAVARYPETIEVFFKYGMGCFACHAAQFENIEQGATMHGINIDQLMAELNASLKTADKE